MLAACSEKEQARGDRAVWSIDANRNVCYVERGGTSIPKHKYDTIFGPDASNRNVYEHIARQFIAPVLSGINGTVFAYGVTSSGKTYTMIGVPEEPGIMPLLVRDLFAAVGQASDKLFTVRMAYMEIYNEVGRAVLVGSSRTLVATA